MQIKNFPNFHKAIGLNIANIAVFAKIHLGVNLTNPKCCLLLNYNKVIFIVWECFAAAAETFHKTSACNNSTCVHAGVNDRCCNNVRCIQPRIKANAAL
jgi:hypothetical protein